jgi:ABC-2 type transport system permease protein
MHKFWLIVQHEYGRHVLKRSFLLATLSVPLVMTIAVVVSFGLRALGGKSVVAVGYVDHAGLLSDVTSVDEAAQATVRWLAFQTENAAQAALEAEQITVYYVLPADYAETRQVQVVYVRKPSGTVTRQFRDLLRSRLLAELRGEIAHRAVEGSTLVVRSPGAAPGSAREFSGSPTIGQLLPAISGFALVIVIFVSSGYLMGAVADEKTNRTMEILVTAISPSRLMTAKLLAVLAITLTQLAIWAVLVGVISMFGSSILDVIWLQHIRVDPYTMVIVLVTLIPSYVLVATLMTALGAIMEGGHSAQYVTTILVALYLTPAMFVVSMLRDLNHPLMVLLSLIPFTAPGVLPLRAAFTQLPFWQVGTSVAIQVLCTLGAVWLAGRALRLGMLRYGRRLRWRELVGLSAEEQTSQPGPGIQRQGAWHVAGIDKPRRSGGKTWLILRHELVTTVTNPMFIVVCVGVPLLVLAQLGMMVYSNRDKPSPHSTSIETGDEPSLPIVSAPEVQGYVDLSGLVETVPPPIPVGTLVPYADEASARRALKEGEIAGFYVIPADYIASGELISIRPDYSPFSPGDTTASMDWMLLVNLLARDPNAPQPTQLAAQVWEPMTLQTTAWVRGSSTGDAETALSEDEAILARLVSMLVMLLLYGMILMASGLMLRSVSEEKKNRVIEILLLSASPQQILAGKTVALGVAGLIQALVWTTMGYLFFALGGEDFSIPGGITLSPSILAWFLVFALLGYAVYASLYAGAGALVPDWRQSRQATLLIALPAFIGFEIGLLTMDNPHGALALSASFFPLTAPFVMIKRLVVGGLPWWQPPVTAGLMVLSIPLIVRAVARMFHAQNLLSGQPFSVKRYFRALLGRA